MRGTKEGGGLWQNAILFGDLGEGSKTKQTYFLMDSSLGMKRTASFATPERMRLPLLLVMLMCLLLPCALREVLLRCFPP